MNTLTTTSVVLPAPRPAINQGIDINNEMVLNLWGGNQFWTVTEWSGSSRKP